VTDQLQAFLDSGTSFEGKIAFSGVVRIDGHFQGDISAEGLLVIGETGLVEANLQVGSLVVQGTIVGDVTAKERVEIGPSGEIEGSVDTPLLKVVEGGRVAARVAMGEPVAAKGVSEGGRPPEPKGPADSAARQG
jgi:cytoskeletal protein CcmA (bactofilin family)